MQDLRRRKEQRLQRSGGYVDAQVDAKALLDAASWPPLSGLELSLRLRPPGGEEVRQVAEIPPKFKPAAPREL